MIVEVQVTIHGSKAAIWTAVSDIENAAKIISGIEKIEVLEKPQSGLVGLRWRETRILFGKPATAEKWITEAAEGDFVKTSTGFAPSGATLDDLRLMRANTSPHIQVKAAGGVRTLDALLEVMAVGVTRCGATATAAMLDDFKARKAGAAHATATASSGLGGGF